MILIACGLQREAKILGRPGVITVPGGGDAARLEMMLASHAARATMIVSSGIAGGLDPALVAGDVVVDCTMPHALDPRVAEGLARMRAALPHAHYGTIVGQDRIAARAIEKAALHAATGAMAVDMESHVAARVAARYGLPFLAIRAISDTAHETLPPAALVGMNPDGSMALGKVLASLARRPGQLPALIRTGRSAEAAFTSLAQLSQALRLTQQN